MINLKTMSVNWAAAHFEDIVASKCVHELHSCRFN